jgi:hypothetical protein
VEQGLLSRFLIAAPDSAAGTRLWRDPLPESEAALQRYEKHLLEILEGPLTLAEGKKNELKPRPLPLSLDARCRWIDYANEVEKAIGPGGVLEPIKGFANKLAEHAARIACVLAFVRDRHTSIIVSTEMEAAIALAQYYAAEALRVFEASRVSVDLQLAQKLLSWLHKSWSEAAISLPDIYQRGPYAIRDKATAERLVNLLVGHGWLKLMIGGATIAGQHRREAWEIVGARERE